MIFRSVECVKKYAWNSGTVPSSSSGTHEPSPYSKDRRYVMP